MRILAGAGRARLRPPRGRALVRAQPGACGPAALYTEEYDVRQRQLRGNLPQAFVHAGMLECAVVLSRDVDMGAGA